MGSVSGKIHKEIMAAVQPIVEAAGARCWFDTGSTHGHGRLIVELNGRTRFSPMSSTPRSKDAVKFKISDVKRILRELAA